MIFIKSCHQTIIFDLILVCPYVGNLQLISETADRTQTKLIERSLPIGEHGLGFLDLACAANKGQKRPIFKFKPLKLLEDLELRAIA